MIRLQKALQSSARPQEGLLKALGEQIQQRQIQQIADNFSARIESSLSLFSIHFSLKFVPLMFHSFPIFFPAFFDILVPGLAE